MTTLGDAVALRDGIFFFGRHYQSGALGMAAIERPLRFCRFPTTPFQSGACPRSREISNSALLYSSSSL